MIVSDISPKVYEMADKAEKMLSEQFTRIDGIAAKNTAKVMAAFQRHKVSEACFAGTTGYGYDDLGRDKLDEIYADVFGAEAALVRLNFVNGTHAITAALCALCAPGETILSINGAPYDTLRKAIGFGDNPEFGSLRFYGINYAQTELLDDGSFDKASIADALSGNPGIKAVIMQRSCGYEDRKTFSIDQIGEICSFIKLLRSDVCIFCDNCYGEFTAELEPTQVGVDLIAGSLIKNPGGGIAPTGAYIAGKRMLVDRAAGRLTSPGIGGECGSTLGNNRFLYQGFFIAPHVVAQALKTVCFAAEMMNILGIDSKPAPQEPRYDIIQRISLGTADGMKRFCAGIQAGAPVDSYVTPEPWAMPGYDCEVIMADGSFIQGSSIELSADGPFREPFNVFLQGGITYESGKLGIMMAVQNMIGD